MASYNPKSSYFCEYRLHAKFQLARLCRSCIFEKVPLSLSDYYRHKSKCSSSLGLSWELNEARLDWQVGVRARLTETMSITSLIIIMGGILAFILKCHEQSFELKNVEPHDEQKTVDKTSEK